MLASPGRISLLAISLLALGCSDPAASKTEDKKAGDEAKAASEDNDAKDPEDAAPTRAEGELLTLGDAKIMREGHEDRAIVIQANGVVVLAGIPFGTLAKDGKVASPDGQPMMEVQADGTVLSAAGPTGIVLDEDGGSLELPKLEVQVRFGEDGKIDTQVAGAHAALLGTDSPALVSEGCTGLMTKTCALITLSYLMALGNPDSAEEPGAE